MDVKKMMLNQKMSLNNGKNGLLTTILFQKSMPLKTN
jgi:hypothetical protein